MNIPPEIEVADNGATIITVDEANMVTHIDHIIGEDVPPEVVDALIDILTK